MVSKIKFGFPGIHGLDWVGDFKERRSGDDGELDADDTALRPVTQRFLQPAPERMGEGGDDGA